MMYVITKLPYLVAARYEFLQRPQFLIYPVSMPLQESSNIEGIQQKNDIKKKKKEQKEKHFK